MKHLPIIAIGAEQESSGFTIVELIVATIVGTMLIIITNGAVSNYTTLSKHSKNLVVANSFAEGKFEALRNQGYNALPVGTTDISAQLPTALLGPRSANLQITSASSGIKKIDLTVSYNDGGSKSYSYTTYIGELGVGQ